MTGGFTHSVLDIVVVRHFVRGAVLWPSPKLLIVPKCCTTRKKIFRIANLKIQLVKIMRPTWVLSTSLMSASLVLQVNVIMMLVGPAPHCPANRRFSKRRRLAALFTPPTRDGYLTRFTVQDAMPVLKQSAI